MGVSVIKHRAENMFPLLGELNGRQDMRESITWAEEEGGGYDDPRLPGML